VPILTVVAVVSPSLSSPPAFTSIPYPGCTVTCPVVATSKLPKSIKELASPVSERRPVAVTTMSSAAVKVKSPLSALAAFRMIPPFVVPMFMALPAIVPAAESLI